MTGRHSARAFVKFTPRRRDNPSSSRAAAAAAAAARVLFRRQRRCAVVLSSRAKREGADGFLGGGGEDDGVLRSAGLRERDFGVFGVRRGRIRFYLVVDVVFFGKVGRCIYDRFVFGLKSNYHCHVYFLKLIYSNILAAPLL